MQKDRNVRYSNGKENSNSKLIIFPEANWAPDIKRNARYSNGKNFTKLLRLGLLFKFSIFTFMQGSLACLRYRHIIWSHLTEPCIRPIRNILHRVLTYPHASTSIHTHPQKTRTYSSCRSSKMTWPDYVSSGRRIRLSPEFSCRLPPSIPGLTQ